MPRSIMASPPSAKTQTGSAIAPHALREHLDHLYATYDPSFLATDPLQFPHRYRDPADQEVVAFIAAGLAYGRVETILQHVGEVLQALGPRPAASVDRFDPRGDGGRFRRFVHRFTRGKDIACLLHLLRQMREIGGSLGGFFLAGFREGEEDVGPALARFVERALALDVSPLYRRALPRQAGVRFFFPSPRDGSACKRLLLFLRWMVRRDALDLGLWPGIPPARLVIPLDTHVARLARALGLTRRASPGWRMAVEVTHSLRRFDPLDPVKYDFALSRLGILEDCPSHADPSRCPLCARGVLAPVRGAGHGP